MAETQESGRESTGLGQQGDPMNPREIAAWFVREVLPLEPVLTYYLQRNWHNPSDIVDLRQEIYAPVCLSAQKELPKEPLRFIAEYCGTAFCKPAELSRIFVKPVAA